MIAAWLAGARLPAGWTVGEIRKVSGDQEAMALDADRSVKAISTRHFAVCRPAGSTPAQRTTGHHRKCGGRLTRGSVPCLHDRRPKGQCRVGARQPCGAKFRSTVRGGGTRSLIVFQGPAKRTSVSWNAPASGPEPRKKRSGTGRHLPRALSGNSWTNSKRLIAASLSAGVTASDSAATSRSCCTRCPGRVRASCVPLWGPSTRKFWREPRPSRLTAWARRGGEVSSGEVSRRQPRRRLQSRRGAARAARARQRRGRAHRRRTGRRDHPVRPAPVTAGRSRGATAAPDPDAEFGAARPDPRGVRCRARRSDRHPGSLGALLTVPLGDSGIVDSGGASGNSWSGPR